MKSWIKALRSPQLWVFLCVGSINTIIGYAIFALGYQVMAWNYNFALALAYAVGVLIAYCNHRHVTFKSTAGHRQALTRFVMTYGVIYLLNAALLTGFKEGLGVNPLLGQILALVIVTLMSFVVQRLWVFKS